MWMLPHVHQTKLIWLNWNSVISVDRCSPQAPDVLVEEIPAPCYLLLPPVEGSWPSDLLAEWGIWMLPHSFSEMPSYQKLVFKLLTSMSWQALTLAALLAKLWKQFSFGEPASISHQVRCLCGEHLLTVQQDPHLRMKWGSKCCRDWSVWDTHGWYCFLIPGHIAPQTAWTSEELVSPPMGEHLLELCLSSILKLYRSIFLLSVIQILSEVATALRGFAMTFPEINWSAVQLEFLLLKKIAHVIKDCTMVHIYEKNKIKVGQTIFILLLHSLPAWHWCFNVLSKQSLWMSFNYRFVRAKLRRVQI